MQALLCGPCCPGHSGAQGTSEGATGDNAWRGQKPAQVKDRTPQMMGHQICSEHPESLHDRLGLATSLGSVVSTSANAARKGQQRAPTSLRWGAHENTHLHCWEGLFVTPPVLPSGRNLFLTWRVFWLRLISPRLARYLGESSQQSTAPERAINPQNHRFKKPHRRLRRREITHWARPNQIPCMPAKRPFPFSKDHNNVDHMTRHHPSAMSLP